MTTLKFDNTTTKKTTTSVDKPILNISRMVFVTNDKNWAQRLFNTMLTVKIVCIRKDKKPGKTFQQEISINSYITPYHRQPVLEPNLWFNFEDSFNNTNDIECESWKTTIELSNLSFKVNESLEITTMDKDHILKRITDWKKRVSNLYKETKSWIKDRPDLLIAIGNPMPMYEGLMQSFKIKPTEIDTADISKGKKYLLSFKPKGLWMIGANGRVDIISRIGSFILIDKADQFETPNWHIYTATDRQNAKPFNQKELFNIINLLQ